MRCDCFDFYGRGCQCPDCGDAHRFGRRCSNTRAIRHLPVQHVRAGRPAGRLELLYRQSSELRQRRTGPDIYRRQRRGRIYIEFSRHQDRRGHNFRNRHAAKLSAPYLFGEWQHGHAVDDLCGNQFHFRRRRLVAMERPECVIFSWSRLCLFFWKSFHCCLGLGGVGKCRWQSLPGR